MQIAHSPTSTIAPSHHTNETGRTQVSDTKTAAELPDNRLQDRLTPRTEDYLLRLRTHGSVSQKPIAVSAFTALLNNIFIANPAQEKPVYQYGVRTTIDNKEGILLANFAPHNNNQLELEALAFSEKRHFENDINKIKIIVLEHARNLPEVKDYQPSGGSNEDTELEASPQQDAATAYKNLMADAKQFQSQSMHRKMANQLAKKNIKEGHYKSRLTALPAAHATVLGARVRQFVSSPFQKAPNAPYSPENQDIPPDREVLPTPPGQQFRFNTKDFTDFYYDHWLESTGNTQETASTENKIDEEAIELPSDTESVSSFATESSFSSERRFGRLFNDTEKNELHQQLDSETTSFASRSDSSLQHRRYGQFISNEMKNKLQQLNLDTSELSKK